MTRRTRTLTVGALLYWGAPLASQGTPADSAHAKAQIVRLAKIRSVVNNSQGAKTMLTEAIAAESLLMRAPVTPPPPNTAPVASFAKSCANLTVSCSVNAGASTDDKGIVAYTWNWGDGSAVSSGVAASHTYPKPGTYAIGLTVRDAEALSATQTQAVVLLAPPVDTVTPPPVPIDTSTVAKITGPYLSSAQQIAMGPTYAEYDAQVARFDDLHWVPYTQNASGYGPESVNYYDRAEFYYVRWQQTGNLMYRQRADSLARDYRKRYVENANYLVAWNNAMSSGLATHYLVAGDTMSRIAVGAMGEAFAWYPNIATTDNRVHGYILKVLLDAHLIAAPSTGKSTLPVVADWGAALRAKLPAILATQAADGAWRKTDCGDGGPLTVHPFTTGILLDQLTRYYDHFEPDARIVDAVKRGADYLWANDWVATANAFKYVERVCPSEGGPTPAPILNGLIVNAYAWLYRMTGDATYKTRATAMVQGTTASGEAGTTNPKQYNQQFSSSYRALYWISK